VDTKWAIGYSEMTNKIRWAVSSTCSTTLDFQAPYTQHQTIAGLFASMVIDAIKENEDAMDVNIAWEIECQLRISPQVLAEAERIVLEKSKKSTSK